MDSAIRGLNALVMICLGLGLGVWLARRRRLPWGLFGIGAATFVLSQIAHIPFNSLVLNRLLSALGWPDAASTGGLIGASVLLGLSAGVFEEGARYLTYRFWAKKARSWEEALMIGAGHGGIEAVLLGLLAAYALLQALALRGVDLTTVVPADQLQTARLQLEAFWATPWYGVLLGAVERLFAICLHLSLSVMVLQCFTRRQWLWLPLAIGWHALLDAVAVAAGVRLGPYWTEALVGLMAMISLAIVFALRQPKVAEPPPTAPLAPQVLQPVDEGPPTRDQLDDSRFSGGT
ncbi:MAG: YhfC family glutamic-type intramembrane protease [Chloroflexi bacterium]|nr:YhfC family glutamic-type intramembrane protease [Chloroflexota bacterium]